MEKKDIRIVILQRGWIYIGEFSKDGVECRLKNAKNIRRWGTTNGLGELAKKGKQEETQLDEAGTVRFHELTIVAMLECDNDVWKF